MKRIYSALVLSVAAFAGAVAQPSFYNAGSVTVQGTGSIYVNGDVQITSSGSITNDGTIEVVGNWQNDRTDGAISNGASGERLVKFTNVGGTQTLSSTSGKLGFYNLETQVPIVVIAGTPYGVQSTADLTVANNVNFNGGSLIMMDKNLTVGLGGTISNGSSSNYGYFTTGTFRKKIANGQPSTLHTFPFYRESIGYVPVKIRLNTAPIQADEVRVGFTPQSTLGNVFFVGGCTNMGAPHPGASNNNIMLNQMVTNFGYWQVDVVDGQSTPQNIDNVSGWNYDITLSPPASVLSSMQTNYGSDYYKLLRIPSHLANGNPITFSAGSSDWSGNVLNSGTFCDGIVPINSYSASTGITATNLNLFSRFGGAGNSGGAGLPISLVSLSANAIDNSFIRVNWVTATEVNNAGFDVLRSIDGTNFTKIGWVDGHTNSTEQLSYSFDDKNADANVLYYYRLNQVDLNGENSQSNIVSAQLRAENVFTVSDFIPNPTSNTSKINIICSETQKVNVTMFNTLGQIIQKEDYNLVTGVNPISFSMSTLADGTYYAVITAGDKVYNKKLIVNKQ